MPEDHSTYVTITKGGSGWFAVQMWWNKDHGGFWEPWDTGVGRYATHEEAATEGREWAESEGQKFHMPELKGASPMSLETFEEQLERNKARGKLEENIPPEIEAAAIALLEQESEAICGVKWVWAEQPAELHNRYRLWAFINASRAPNAAPPPAAVPEPRPDNWPLPSFDAREERDPWCASKGASTACS